MIRKILFSVAIAGMLLGSSYVSLNHSSQQALTMQPDAQGRGAIGD